MKPTRIATLALLAVIARAGTARADVLWYMDWAHETCRPVRTEVIVSETSDIRHRGSATSMGLENFYDGPVRVRRETITWKSDGQSNQFVYVSDYGYCLAEFYNYRADEFRLRSGQPTVINSHR